jgi:hypothetical protein
MGILLMVTILMPDTTGARLQKPLIRFFKIFQQDRCCVQVLTEAHIIAQNFPDGKAFGTGVRFINPEFKFYGTNPGMGP